MPSADQSALEKAREKLKLKNFETIRDFKSRHPQADFLFKERGVDLGKIREHSGKVISTGLLAGAVLAGPQIQATDIPPPNELIAKAKENLKIDLDDSKIKINPTANKATNHEVLKDILKDFLPQYTRPLTRNEEKYLEIVLSDLTGVPVKATLEGEHLNTTYGRIGAEQHLKRYPGDVLANHSPAKDEYGGENPQEILKEGIAPGLGAWGYFAKSEDQLTDHLAENEKWYAVVQTLYLPDWNARQPYLRDWYKYRKVLIVNTQNGNAVVASIADSGPAAWTGKHYGGSPEVMDYLGGAKYKKGPVLLFFVDDPENKVPLGPVEYDKLDLGKIAMGG